MEVAGNRDRARRRLGFPLRLQLFLRSLSLQASWNHERMQNLGLLTTLLPWVRSRRGNLDQDRTFCRRYYEYFNTNPYLAGYLIGGLVRLEDDKRAGVEFSADLTVTYRDSMGRALASLGDQLFWLGIRPALIMAICLLGLQGLKDLVFVVLAVFALGQLTLRWRGLSVGYEHGLALVDVLQHPAWHRSIAWAERIGMILTGMTAGAYLALVSGPGVAIDHSLLWVGVGVGLGLPIALRRRLPGELLILVGLGLALLLIFAETAVGS